MHAILSKHHHSGERQPWARLLLSGLFFTLTLLAVAPAFAAGRVIWKKTTIEEHIAKEAWYLELEVHLPKPPDVGQKSMKFEFTQWSEFERSLVDGKETPEERTVPLSNQQALIESQLVGFMDPGTGQIQTRTRFSFKVTRAHGYRAGQWKVKIKDGDTGSVVGTETTLTFKGENPIVDRRSIVFTGTSKKKKDDDASEGSSGKTITDLNAPDEPGSSAPVNNSAPEDTEPYDEGDVPPAVEERPGGGCHYGPHDNGSWAWGVIIGLFALVFVMRRHLG